MTTRLLGLEFVDSIEDSSGTLVAESGCPELDSMKAYSFFPGKRKSVDSKVSCKFWNNYPGESFLPKGGHYFRRYLETYYCLR